MKVVTFKIDAETLKKIDEVARMLEVPRSYVIRLAIHRFLDSLDAWKPRYRVVKLTR